MPDKTKTILIIEDEETISSMYKAKLEESGKFKVLTAYDGVSGLEAARKEKPDIVMLDVILPQIDGFSVLAELKKKDSTKKIPVIMLTNLGTDEDKEKGKKLGAADYLVKANLTPSQVEEKIKQYFK
ncbi:response regulator [Patescibacteria group bacterium]|nr:response regulator transcription factor [Candidatus Falkowbacteria bacterium]MBU3906239.1 response regulator [Patescibacteria group bacterium]MCG2698406.1 response regulator [Candidatus Parcubacteria bacterium]MBU4014581.1 response regulator [Patescibacteria group bacterium]MBU4026868.1 response regulator [Patescibacteria group bacterium]